MLQWGSSLGLLSNTYSIHNALGDKRNPPVFNLMPSSELHLNQHTIMHSKLLFHHT